MRILLTLFAIIILTSALYSQQVTDTSKVLLRFSEPMSHEGIFNVENYQVLNEDNSLVRIYKVGVVPGDTAVVLFTEGQVRDKKYKVRVSNLKDRSGNLISASKNEAFY